MEAGIAAALRAENDARCRPLLPDDEVRRIATSVSRYVPAPDSSAEGAASAVLIALSAVAPESVQFIWQDRIARGKLNLIVGDPGLGKSFITLDIAARVSQGAEWPDGGRAPTADVVLLCAEDGLADTVRPRLDALGADVNRIHALTAVRLRDGNERHFSLVEDLKHLEKAIERTSAAVLVIDPLTAYLGRTDSYKDSEVRGF